MKPQTSITSVLGLCCLLLSQSAKSQALLTPDDLVAIHQQKDTAKISADLTNRGYKISRDQENRSSSWGFFSSRGQGIDFFVSKTTEKGGTKTTFYNITNSYYFKEFMGNMVKTKYLFTEVKMIDRLAYMAFQKNGITLLVYSYRKPNAKDDDGTDFVIRIRDEAAVATLVER